MLTYHVLRLAERLIGIGWVILGELGCLHVHVEAVSLVLGVIHNNREKQRG